jgi:hypothetical protein
MAGDADDRRRLWGRVAALAIGAVALLPTQESAAQSPSPPLILRYEAYAAGFPVVNFDFRLDESGAGYVVDGQIRAVGLLGLFYNFAMQAESRGAIAIADLRPRLHEHRLRSRGRDRQARLDFAGDGTVTAALVPPEESGRPKPTAQQMLHTVDPLTAILAIGHAVARSGRCGGSVAVFDGRRRYDLVLTDDGSERLEASSGNAYAGEVRRCLVAAVKIAGFSFDQDYSPHTSNGRVWLAAPRPGAPALPIRIEFSSSWGDIEVRMTGIGPAK